MLGRIINEEEILNSILKDKNLERDKYYIGISVLIKYFYNEGCTDKAVLREKIIDTMTEMDETFSRSAWVKYIDNKIPSIIRNIKKNNLENPLVQIQSLPIYKSEIDKINTIKDKKVKKMMFIMLLYSRLSYMINPNGNGWYSRNINDLSKEARNDSSYKNSDERCLVEYELYKMKFIEYGAINKKTLRVTFLETNLESPIAFEVEDLNDCMSIYTYLKEVEGEKWIKCPDCGGYFKKKSNRQERCSKCAKIKQKELQKESMRKSRSS